MNDINLIGKFTKEFEYSHTTNNIELFGSVLSVHRLSDKSDNIPIITSNPIYNLGETYYVHGELRVFNKHGRSMYYVYPDFMYQVNESYQNEVELSGRVCTCSDIRKTPLGSKIKDIMLNVWTDKKSYNIPLIFWNGLANTKLYVGDELHIKGRLQSRTYVKNDIPREIIEVSVNEIM